MDWIKNRIDELEKLGLSKVKAEVLRKLNIFSADELNSVIRVLVNPKLEEELYLLYDAKNSGLINSKGCIAYMDILLGGINVDLAKVIMLDNSLSDSKKIKRIIKCKKKII